MNDIKHQNQLDQFKYGVDNIALDPNTLAQQQAFVQALQQGANGQGPSVANAMLNNAQQQNAAGANSLMAGQRGVNAGMAMRQAQMAQNQGNQQAAAQGVAARNQEMLNNRSMLGSQLNNMQQQGLQVGAQNQNATLASKGLAAGAQAQKNSQGNDMLGGLMQGAGMAMMMLAKGGMIPPKMAEGGGIAPVAPLDTSGPSSAVGRYYAMSQSPSVSTFQNAIGKVGDAYTKKYGDKSQTPTTTPGQTAEGAPMQQSMTRPDDAYMPGDGFARGGKVPAMVSPGERYLSPKEVEKVAEGKKAAIKAGEKIPGKPKVAGSKDSYANDTVNKSLEPGGIVLPRHITQSKDAPKKAADFVRAILAKQGLK